MKISEITVEAVAKFLRLERGDYDPEEVKAVMDASRTYIASFTGIPEASKVAGTETLDDHQDFYIAYMVLCQDMYENRAYEVENSNVNRVVDNILGMHARNLL